MAPRSSGSSRSPKPRRTRTRVEPERDVDDVEMIRAEEFVESLDGDDSQAEPAEPPSRRESTAREGTAREGTAREGTAREATAREGTRREGARAGRESRRTESQRSESAEPLARRSAEADDDGPSRASDAEPDIAPRRASLRSRAAMEPAVEREASSRDDSSDRSQREQDDFQSDQSPPDESSGTFSRENYAEGQLSEPGGGGGGGDDFGDDQLPRRRRRRRRRRGRPMDGPPNMQHGQHRHRRGPGPMQNGRTRQDREPRYDQDREGRVDNAPSLGTLEGVLELHPKGYGFLRDAKNNYSATKTDPFVPGSLIEKCRLREGVMIKGEICAGNRGQGPRLKSIESVDGKTLEEYQKIKDFDSLTAINPFEQIKLETGPQPVTMRVMDLLTPIGKGQRALIVAPPRTGKTMLMQEIANAVSTNHPEVHLIVLLIDERPEEVTDMRRKVRGEVIASSMDRDVESHVRISQLIFERAKRLAEAGKDVFVLLDSITRTARAFNKWIGNSGRTGTGGLDVKAMDIPRKMFGTARRFDEGGSLTVVATALIDTGSAMDQAIFQEFKGTGNMEMVLNRGLADRRIWPSIDIKQSGTRREEKILSPEMLEGITMLRRSLVSLDSVEAMEQLTKTLGRFPSNREFLAKVKAIL